MAALPQTSPHQITVSAKGKVDRDPLDHVYSGHVISWVKADASVPDFSVNFIAESPFRNYDPETHTGVVKKHDGEKRYTYNIGMDSQTADPEVIVRG